MIKTFVAYTDELDDETLAINQIKEQLGLEENLLKNSIGIIACHYEFVLSGVVKAICDALPFDVVGTITSNLSIADNADSLVLSIMLITSDDVEFEKVITSSLLNEPGKIIAESYKEAAAKRLDKPSLIFTFAPFMYQNSGDEYANVITEVSGGVPCFGTIAVDDTPNLSSSYMIAEGEHHLDKMAMVLFYGKVQPKFYIANISPNKAFDKSALITKSSGHVIMEVNGRHISKFFEELGLAKASEDAYAMASLPFLLDYNDNTPWVSKVFVGLTPENYAICAGATPEGSTLYITPTDKEDILFTTGQAADQILKDIENASGLLIYSCVGRIMTLGVDQYGEMDLVDKKVAGRLPFMMVCSGGEFCPTQDLSNKAVNRFHNDAFVACLF
ncbi:MAG: FIST C-terminal domain-containing protein [Defluviitaleaceae bacterium]|nr:FIST C-terminal domain-containing protein [Defluviitaleaceae bacterium]